MVEMFFLLIGVPGNFLKSRSKHCESDLLAYLISYVALNIWLGVWVLALDCC